MNYLDIIILSVVGFSTALAFFRGLITEFLSLVVWAGAFYVTAKFAPDVSAMLAQQVEDPFRSLLAFGVTFLGALFIGGILNLVITLLLRFLKIIFPDRLLGLVFGFLRGMVVIGIASLIISKTPLANKEFVNKISSEAKTWQSEGGLKAKLSPIIVDILTGESTFSPYAVKWGNLLADLMPKDFLAQMDSATLLHTNDLPSLPDQSKSETIPNIPPIERPKPASLGNDHDALLNLKETPE